MLRKLDPTEEACQQLIESFEEKCCASGPFSMGDLQSTLAAFEPFQKTKSMPRMLDLFAAHVLLNQIETNSAICNLYFQYYVHSCTVQDCISLVKYLSGEEALRPTRYTSLDSFLMERVFIRAPLEFEPSAISALLLRLSVLRTAGAADRGMVPLLHYASSLSEIGFQLEPKAYNACLLGLTRNGSAECEEFFERMKENGLATYQSYEMILRYLILKKDFEKARRYESELFSQSLFKAAVSEEGSEAELEFSSHESELESGAEVAQPDPAGGPADLLSAEQACYIKLVKYYVYAGSTEDFRRLLTAAMSAYSGQIGFRDKIYFNALLSLTRSGASYSEIQSVLWLIVDPMTCLPSNPSFYSLIFGFYFQHDKDSLVKFFQNLPAETERKAPFFLSSILKCLLGKSPLPSRRLVSALTWKAFQIERHVLGKPKSPLATVLYDWDDSLGSIFHFAELKGLPIPDTLYYRIVKKAYYTRYYNLVIDLFHILGKSQPEKIHAKSVPVYYASLIRKNEWELIRALLFLFTARTKEWHESNANLLRFLQNYKRPLFSDATLLADLSLPPETLGIQQKYKTLGEVRKSIQLNFELLETLPKELQDALFIPPYLIDFGKKWLEENEMYCS